MAPQRIEQTILREQQEGFKVKKQPGDQFPFQIPSAMLVSWSLYHRKTSFNCLFVKC